MRSNDMGGWNFLAMTLLVSTIACTANVAWADDRTVFRLTSLNLRDPHFYYNFLGSCRDVTDTPLFGFSVNGEIAQEMAEDSDLDGYLDLSLLLILRSTLDLEGCDSLVFVNGLCSTPADATECRTDPGGRSSSTLFSTSSAEVCLGPLAGTIRPYVPAVTSVRAPCFFSAPTSVFLVTGGTPIALDDTTVGGTLVGVPPTQVTNGLVRGFLDETDANNIVIPGTVPLVGGQPLSSLLPGGDPPGTGTSCATHSDLDVGLDGFTRGWWFYYNFTAEVVPFLCDHPADFDLNCRVDLDDYRSSWSCSQDPTDCHCTSADLNRDGHIDLRDFSALQRCFSGEGDSGDFACLGE